MFAGLTSGNVSISQITNNWQSLAAFGAGYGVCFLFGFLFVLIMPIVACCFCCCRCCCGNCGGDMKQKSSDVKKGCCIGMIIALYVMVTLVAGAAVCIIVTSDSMNTAIGEAGPTIASSLSDVSTYLNNTVDEIKHVATTNYEFTAKVISRDLDNIGQLVGVPIQNALGTTGGVDAAVQSVLDLDSKITQSIPLFADYSAKWTVLKTAMTALSSLLATAKANVETVKTKNKCTNDPNCNALTPATYVTALDATATIFNLSAEEMGMQHVASQDLAGKLNTGKSSFDNIPNQVNTSSSTAVNDITTKLNSFVSGVDGNLGGINDMSSKLSVDDMAKTIDDYSNLLKTYSIYVWYGMLGLGGLIGLLTLIQLIGLVFGCCSYNPKRYPTERTCPSNSGGNILMAAAGLQMIFSPLFMLFVCLTFLIGCPLEGLVCSQLRNLDSPLFTKLIDKPDAIRTGYILSDTLFSNGSIPMTVSGILKDCKAGKAAYPTLKLNNFVDINSVLDYKKNVDITGQINSVSIDLSAVQLLSADTISELDALKLAATINWSGIAAEQAKNPTDLDMLTEASKLTTAANAINGNEQTSLRGVADSMRNGNTNQLATAKTALSDFILSTKALKDVLGDVPTGVDQSKTKMTSAETYVQTNSNGIITTALTDMGNRISGIVDSYVKQALTTMNEKLGACTPLYNVWVAIADLALCRYIISSLNSFWFCLGWATFMMIPSMILSVKLAAYFRKMESCSGFDDTDEIAMYTQSAPPTKLGKKNKVKPMNEQW
ncbi:prominin-1-like isoform X2 [Tubulanus polymorphus]